MGTVCVMSDASHVVCVAPSTMKMSISISQWKSLVLFAESLLYGRQLISATVWSYNTPYQFQSEEGCSTKANKKFFCKKLRKNKKKFFVCFCRVALLRLKLIWCVIRSNGDVYQLLTVWEWFCKKRRCYLVENQNVDDLPWLHSQTIAWWLSKQHGIYPMSHALLCFCFDPCHVDLLICLFDHCDVWLTNETTNDGDKLDPNSHASVQKPMCHYSSAYFKPNDPR